MKSDITLEDYRVNIVSNHADFEINNLVIKGDETEIISGKSELKSKLKVNKDGIEIDSISIGLIKQNIVINRTGLLMGGNQYEGYSLIQLKNKYGTTLIKTNGISTNKVSSKEIRTEDLLVGNSISDNPQLGNIKVTNKQGEVVVTIDGEKEKINTNKIEAKEAKIKEAKIKELLIGSEELRSDIRGRNVVVENDRVSTGGMVRAGDDRVATGLVQAGERVQAGGGIVEEKERFVSVWKPVPGSIKLINKDGKNAIVIDGAKEDIWLESIGSLKDKIKELDDIISKLKKAHPEIDF